MALAAAGCGFSPAAVSGDAGTIADGVEPGIDAAPHFRKKLTLTVGSPTELADFPVSIVTTDPELAQRARADGSDIGFTALDGTPLAGELVTFDKPSGALEAWVRLPHVTDTLEIYMTYGAEPAVDAGPVWTPAIYAAAWHLSDSTGPWTDSAAGHTVTPVSPETTAAIGPGIVGTARVFDGIDDATPGGDPADGSLDFGTGSFSIQVWVDVTHSADAYDEVIDKGGDTNLPGYCLTLGTANWNAEVGDNNYAATSFGTETSLLGRWNQLTAVIDRQAGILYAFTNGAIASSTSLGAMGSVDTSYGFAIGSSNTNYRFEGAVDEVRLVKRALSADWIAAEYRNATMRAQFVTFGAEEQR